MGRRVVASRQLERIRVERIILETENRGSKKRKATERSTSSVSIRVQDNNNEVEHVCRQFKSEKSIEKNEDQISEIVINIDGYLQKRATPLNNISDMNKSRKMCKVPSNIRGLHTQSFDPRLVSIGPFHRHKEHLLPMEEHKWRLLSNVLKKINMINQEKFEPALPNTNSNQIRCLVAAIKELEANARACYSETFDKFGPNEFVMMMLLDGCFVVELLRLYAKCEQEGVDDDPMFSSRWMLPNLQHDLVMFENQLPYIVIEKIFNISTGPKNESCSLPELTLRFFDSLLPRNREVLNNCKVNPEPNHLLGLFRSSFLSSLEVDDKARSFALTKKWQLINCVTELREAGIVFKKSENCHLLNIKFEKGKLYIPPLHVDDHTGTVFLNFVAYEQCNRYSKPFFTHYLSFLDSLVNSSKDAEYLQKKGIIDHSLGCEEDVADLFNKLCKEVVYDVNDCYLSKTLEEVNQYCCKRRHKWWAKFNHDYVSTPWKLASLIAATLLLILTFIQTFFAVFAYILPRS